MSTEKNDIWVSNKPVCIGNLENTKCLNSLRTKQLQNVNRETNGELENAECPYMSLFLKCCCQKRSDLFLFNWPIRSCFDKGGAATVFSI